MMKEKTIQLALATMLIGGILFLACQKEDPLTHTPETETGITLKSGPIDCSTHCIDSDDPVYCEMEQQETVTWGNPRNPFTKTTDIVYYNTLTNFVLKVMSTHGWADLLIDGESVWTQGPVAANEWGQYETELPAEWEAGDAYNFQLKVAGFGPPAYFDLAYQLIGECVYYTLSLAVYPEGAGTVTGQGEYMEGEEVALTATANDGYVFVNWTDGDDTEISNMVDFTYTMPAYDVTLTANFEETTFELSLAVNPEDAGTVTGGGQYMAGEQISIAATANYLLGWKFVNWTGDTDYLDDPTSVNTTVNMPEQNISLTAIFEEREIIYGGGATDIDGNEYITVIIGNQEWMAENLKTTQYRNGTLVEYPGTDNNAWAYNTNGAYAWFDNDISWKDSYGALYNWYAVNNAAGLCPAGWSVPSLDDWTQLVNYVVDQGFPNNNVSNSASNALKSCRQVDSEQGGDCNTSVHPRWHSSGTHQGFDEFGFSALPGGGRWSVGIFDNVGISGSWWSASECSGVSSWIRYMGSYYGTLNSGDFLKVYGFSVRCLRNDD